MYYFGPSKMRLVSFHGVSAMNIKNQKRIVAITVLILPLFVHLCLGGLGCKSAKNPGSQDGGQELKAVKITFQPVISGVEEVYVAGTFNDWNMSQNAMTDEDGDGIFEATLLLVPGRYLYKFIVDQKWITDPNANEYEPDQQGGRNAVLVVDHRFQSIDNKPGDGQILVDNIKLNFDYTMVNPLQDDIVEFTTRANRNDVETIHLITWVRGKRQVSPPLILSGGDVAFQYYTTSMNIENGHTVHFSFMYKDGEKALYATPKGFLDEEPSSDMMFFYSEHLLPKFETPDWVKHGVFYQIFPDRFWNGDKANDQTFDEPYYEGITELPESGKTNGEYFHLVKDWQNVNGLSESPYRTDGRPDYFSFYGGDISGVMEKLPYLADLGVTIIYFNPLNEGQSNHKYDPIDYLTIDPHFADEATFIEFVKQAHGVGIRIIVDKAFNHTGDWHFAFVDTKEKGPESKYWSWYEWNRWPLPPEGPPTPCDYYDCWWGYPIHPNLNFDLSRPNAQENDITDISQVEPNKEVVNYILEVARYWLGKLDIDGFRLDVPNEVPFWFWKEFRRVVDEVKPDAYLIGEIWGNAMPWMGPHYFHSTMNYKYFREPVMKFLGLGQGDALQFDRELAPGRHMYPMQATQVMMNLVGSHDTERYITMIGGDTRRLKNTVLFQMTYLGVPHIYYGDEVALEGGRDPDNRRPFPWNWESDSTASDIHEFYKRLIKIRHTYSALRTGSFQTIVTEGNVFGYRRKDQKNEILVFINNGEQTREITLIAASLGLSESGRLVSLLNEQTNRYQDGEIHLTIPPVSGNLFLVDLTN